MIPLWLIPLFPLVGTIVLAIIALSSSDSKQGPAESITGAVAVLFPILSFLSVVTLSVGMPVEGIRGTIGTWIDTAAIQVNIGFLFDGLSRVMLLFITGIGSLIAIYSVGYMHKDRSFARFFAYINLFLFSMTVLVLADSLLLTFLGWEGVGLCSYLLIGFWHTDLKNTKAGNKAFIVNRVGDVGFLLGMLCLVSIGGSALLSYDALNAWLLNALSLGSISNAMPLLSLAGLLFFFGCTGKSAQIPLLTWLPDAMAGPTPVSALIHAATMVTSGVYLLARLSNLFVLIPAVLNIVLFVGLLTAFWAAIAGLFQNGIKKVLAYSTISQLGYMFMAAGVAAFDVSIFHVFTHAFFKAALFLGAGAVIHSLTGEQDMRRMGGLLKKMPLTSLVMIFGFLAIIGFPGFAGFWSKDLILERLYVSGPMGPYVYAIALLTAVITAVYMGRLIIMTFFGKYRGSKENEAHIHEAPATMLIPMLILSVGSAFAGFLWAGLIPGADFFREMLAPVVGAAQAYAELGHTAAHLSPWIFAGLGTLAALIGIAIAWFLFMRPVPEAKGGSEPQGFGASWTFAFDKLHEWIGVIPTKVIAWFLDVVLNNIILAAQWLIGGIIEILGDGVRAFQVRKVRLQAAFSLIGMALITILVLIYGGLL
jgi:NADH-quinone oxidoreductase subunit L